MSKRNVMRMLTAWIWVHVIVALALVVTGNWYLVVAMLLAAGSMYLVRYVVDACYDFFSSR